MKERPNPMKRIRIRIALPRMEKGADAVGHLRAALHDEVGIWEPAGGFGFQSKL